MDRSSAGWAYRTVSPRVAEADDGLIAWMPLIDGAARLGVLEVRTASLDGIRMRRTRMLAHLFVMLITSKRAYSDWLAARTRTASMSPVAAVATWSTSSAPSTRRSPNGCPTTSAPACCVGSMQRPEHCAGPIAVTPHRW
ncbi:hypothetical protein [Streptomyces sp. NPDC001410]|uniref:hypothetical protein n=1 Tax=Streptomyces sp. NPDC001410 TaxID=3364574 RepID=UPI0036CC0BD6